MPPSHPCVIGRLMFVGLFTAPSVRQYYIYVTDTRCKRLGTQCWVYIAILVSEAVLCIKNGKELFERTQVKNIIFWLFVQAAVSMLFIFGCMLWHRYVDVSIDLHGVFSSDKDYFLHAFVGWRITRGIASKTAEPRVQRFCHRIGWFQRYVTTCDLSVGASLRLYNLIILIFATSWNSFVIAIFVGL